MERQVSLLRNLGRIVYLELVWGFRIRESVIYNVLAPALVLLLLGLARPAGSSLHVLVPGLLALTVASSALRGVGTTVSLMRSYGSWRTLQASAIPTPLYLAGLVGSRIVRTVLVIAFMFLVATVALGYRTGASLFVLLLYVLFGAAVFSAFGLFFAYAMRPQAVSGGLNLVLLPMIFLSNVLFIAREEWLRTLSLFLPLTYLSDLIRGHLQGLEPTRETWQNLAVLAAWLVASSCAALALARRRVEEE